MFNYKNIPVSLKIAFAFFLLGFFLLSILFLLIIPKIQQDQYNNALEHTEKKVLLIKQQIKLVVDYFGKYGEVKKKNQKKR
ncbi:hypothetical protein [Halarcobacter anaerophilus]|uniref:hypothetical protein n=1 Tax=Halarcobacter anaerophilus TaxID=877500 RepID=UPI0005C86C57|nr:hypothetical protein [Halarcobacter anaerophilus]